VRRNVSKLEARLAYEERCRRRQRQQTTRQTSSRSSAFYQCGSQRISIGITQTVLFSTQALLHFILLHLCLLVILVLLAMSRVAVLVLLMVVCRDSAGNVRWYMVCQIKVNLCFWAVLNSQSVCNKVMGYSYFYMNRMLMFAVLLKHG